MRTGPHSVREAIFKGKFYVYDAHGNRLANVPNAEVGHRVARALNLMDAIAEATSRALVLDALRNGPVTTAAMSALADEIEVALK